MSKFIIYFHCCLKRFIFFTRYVGHKALFRVERLNSITEMLTIWNNSGTANAKISNFQSASLKK